LKVKHNHKLRKLYVAAKEVKLKNPYEHLDLLTLKKLITLFDSYRIHRCEDFRWVDKAVNDGKLKKRFANEWKKHRKILSKMASLPRTLPNVKRLIKIRLVVRSLAAVYISLAAIFFMANVLIRNSNLSISVPDFSSPAFFLIAITSVGALILSSMLNLFVNWRVALALDKYVKEHPEKLKVHRRRLKVIVQNLIYEAIRRIKELHELDNDTIELYTTEYESIDVVEEPKRTRNYFIAKLKKE